MTSTKHSSNCTMSFGRKSPLGDCARCDELRAGSAPRDGWQKDYYSSKKREAAQRAAAIHFHFTSPDSPHAHGKCGPVCTFGDW